MITKERLLELIEQGATIYEVKYGKINPVSLKNKIRFVSEKYPVIVFEPIPDERYKHHKYFDKLFETLEEAEWHKEFGCIERTERLELPTWEEFKLRRPYSYFIFTSKDMQYGLGIGAYYREIIINNNGSILFQKPLTKENYTEACRKCKKLFLNGE